MTEVSFDTEDRSQIVQMLELVRYMTSLYDVSVLGQEHNLKVKNSGGLVGFESSHPPRVDQT